MTTPEQANETEELPEELQVLERAREVVAQRLNPLKERVDETADHYGEVAEQGPDALAKAIEDHVPEAIQQIANGYVTLVGVGIALAALAPKDEHRQLLAEGLTNMTKGLETSVVFGTIAELLGESLREEEAEEGAE